jgi:hypothetical protein
MKCQESPRVHAGEYVKGSEQVKLERLNTERERQRAEAERERADREREQKERLAAYLRSQGIDPDLI